MGRRHGRAKGHHQERVLCGASINYANCMFGKAFALKSTVPGYSGPTKTRKDWVFVVVEHVWFKMIRVAITLNGDSVHAEVIGAVRLSLFGIRLT